ncbi:MAG TPA: hypothetical protein VMS63_08145 [Gaiellaceae bacterium]|nr:hypothetical protein [Gaiellaceae bacterium]
MNAVPSPLRSPYKGLAPFEDSEQDALLFFGREREREVVVANMLASRLTVLYGESGVGKSSLLAAGVARELRARAPGAVVSARDTWSGSLEGTFDDVRDADESYLILDQFEEYFLYHGDDDSPGTLVHDLPELLADTRVHVLVSLREDALAHLDAFKARIPGVFANQLRLEHLDAASARAAILGPIARWNEVTGESVEIEDALVEAVLQDVEVEGRSQGIEAPYLQLVLERIWDTEREAGSTVLRVATLQALGGARTIVRQHVLRALAALPSAEQDVAASMFDHLVTPSGTKIAHRAPDLAEYADVREDALRRVLTTLTRERIVHSVDGSDRYEIFHDVLAEPIRAWRQQRRLERERLVARRRQRRLYVVVAVALVALGAFAGLAAWALSERSTARSQAHHARARELEATALQRLTVNPNGSVAAALAAARLEPGPASELVLREALLADRLLLVRRTGGDVSGVAALPRGHLVAAGTTTGQVIVVDARTGRVVRRLDAGRPVSALDFAADGTLVVASAGRAATVWSVRTGRQVRTERPVAAAVRPDGRLETVPLRRRLAAVDPGVQRLSVAPASGLTAAAVKQRDGHVRAWVFARDGRLLRVLPQIGIKDVAFSPDGRLVATASADGTAVIWNARSGKCVRVLLDSKNGVNVLAFSPDGKLLATGGQDSGVRIWTLATGARTFFLLGHTNPVTAVAWSPDGRVVASGSLDRTIMLWRVQTQVGSGGLAAALAGHTEAVETLAFSADGTELVSGGDDGTVRVWNALPDQELALLGRGPGTALAARWMGGDVVAAWEPGTVKVYDASSRKLVHTLRAPAGTRLTSLAVATDGWVVAAGGADGTTNAWDGQTGRKLLSVAAAAPVQAVAVSSNGGLVASGDERGNVRVWDVQSGKLRWAAFQGAAVADVAFSPRSDRLVTSGPQGAALWSVSNGRLLHRLSSRGGVVRSVFSPDGRLVATAGADSNARLWYARTGRLYRVFRGHTAALIDLAFSSNGRLLATSSEDADGRIWNVVTGKHGPVLRGAFGRVTAISFSADNRWIVTAGPIAALLWPTASGRLLFYLRGHGSLLTGVSFSPRGATILSSSRDGTVRTYACDVCVDLAALVRLAERRLALSR